MAVPSVVGVGTAAAGTGTVTPTLPSGVQADDILLLFVENYYNEKSTATGYTELVTYKHTTPNRTITVLWKRAGSSESDPTVSDSGDFQIAAVMAVRGCLTTGSPFGEVFGGAHSAGSTGLLPAIKTYVSDCLYVGAVGGAVDNKTTANYSGWTNANLTSITEQLDYFSDAGYGGGLGIVTGSKASAGSITTTSFSQSSYIAGATVAFAMLPSSTTGVYIRGRGPASNSAAALSAQVPYGTAENDILVAFVETSNEAVTVTDYTEAGSSPASNSGTNPTRLSVFYKRAGASETTASVSDSGNHQTVQIVGVVGAKTSGDPFNVTASSTGGTGTSVTIPGATTTSNNTLVLAAMSASGSSYVSTFTNSNLTGLQTVVGEYGSSGNGGSIAMAAGKLATAGSYGNTTGTITSSEWTGWSGAVEPVAAAITLSADAGTMSLAGTDVDFGRLFADASAVTLTGADASFTRQMLLGVSSGTYALTGQSVTESFGLGFSAEAGALALAGETANIEGNHVVMQAAAGELALAEGRYRIEAANPAKSELNFLIDLVPDMPAGNYQRYSERLYVGGTEVPLISWTYSESPSAIGGRLEFEIADMSQRNLFFSGAAVTFEIGVWNGSAYVWTSLLNTGVLKNSQYSVAATGTAARETLTVTAASEMEDRLNTAADANVHIIDPDNAPGYNAWGSITYDSTMKLPSIRKLNGQTVSAKEVELPAMGLHALFNHIFITECGFSRVVTNLPDFKITSFDCRAGEPYFTAVGGLIGMFEPVFSVFKDGEQLVLVISDGISGDIPSTGGGRTLNVSQATALSIESELVKRTGETQNDGAPSADEAGQFVGWLDLTFNEKATARDWQSSAERIVNETVKSGATTADGEQYVQQAIRKTFVDYYDSRYGDVPVRSDLKMLSVDTSMYKKFTSLGGWEFYLLFHPEDFTERYEYDDGEMVRRYRHTSGELVKIYFDEAENKEKWEKINLVLSIEDERIERKWHPFIPGRLYIASREVLVDGAILVDKVNGQEESAHMRPVLEVTRSGNMTADQYIDWGRISSVRETFDPNGDGTVSMSKVETDFLAGQVSYNESRVDDGQIGYNARSGKQEKVAVTPEGADDAWGLAKLIGKGIPFNAGPLPRSLGVAVGKRYLRNMRRVRKTYSLQMIGLDPHLHQGMRIAAYGPSNAYLGGFIVESRTLTGGQSGYTMKVQARTSGF